MKILIAPDSFKGSSSSLQVAEAIEKGIYKVFPDAEIEKIPIADGGEGTVEAMVAADEGDMINLTVTGPLGNKVEAHYGLIDATAAVIEMASASGLVLVPDEKRNAKISSTYGTGELILHALDQGVEEIILGIGGSATNDGGTGMASALGYRFLDAQGNVLPPGGESLQKLAHIDSSRVDPRIATTRFRVACDVNNPLNGPQGASEVYGPQKGAGPEDVKILDAALKNLADVVKKELKVDASETPGAGAAGGLGYGLLAFCGASLEVGIDLILDAVDFENRLDEVDLLITGEGKMDGQTIYGKVPVGISQRAQKFGIPVLAVVGDIGEGIENVYDLGITAVMSTVNRAMTLQEAMDNGYELLIDATERAMRMLQLGSNLC